MASAEGLGVIAAGTTGTWNNVAMFIPSIAASRLDGCSIINVHYVLKASMTFLSVPFWSCVSVAGPHRRRRRGRLARPPPPKKKNPENTFRAIMT